MKNIILIVIGVLIALYTITIGFSAFSTQTRKNELENNVSHIVASTLKNYYKNGDEEQIRQEMIDEIEQSLGADANVVIAVRELDLQKGIISVKVEEHFANFNGKEKTLVCEKTVIMEQHMREEETVLVRFMAGGELYKEYLLMEGECCPMPKLPNEQYEGWAKQESPNIKVTEIKEVWEDQVYVAIVE